MRLEPELVVRVEKLNVYKCKKCPKVFPKLSDLKKHKTFHEDSFLSHILSAYVVVKREKIFKCEECTLSFNTRRELMLHKLDHIQKNVRDERKAKRCQTNNNIVKPYKCPDCDYRFVAASTLAEHSILHKPFPYICECGIGYYKQHDLKTHMRLVHRKELVPNLSIPSKEGQENKLVPERKTNGPRGPSLKAELVKKKPAKKKWKLKIKGQNGEAKGKRTLCNIPKPDIEIRKTSDNRYECPQCKKLLSSKNLVYIHYRLHTGDLPYTCELCGKSFAQKAVCKGHMERHQTERSFMCRYCEKGFTTAQYLARHEDTHNLVKKHECPFCGKGFNDPSALTRHKRIHTGEKRYPCPHCPKAFTDISGLKGHKLRHEKNRKFVCEQCSKKFYSLHDLENHMVVHNLDRKFCCDYCKKFFSLKAHLYLHIKGHSQIKRFKCDQCPRRFVLKQYLARHVLQVHKKVSFKSNRILECDDCSVQIIGRPNFIRHYLNKHSKIRCKICSTRFMSNTDLRAHRLKNSESCEICDKEFFCYKMKDRHILTVHKKKKT